jgi:hypothetical protein
MPGGSAPFDGSVLDRIKEEDDALGPKQRACGAFLFPACAPEVRVEEDAQGDPCPAEKGAEEEELGQLKVPAEEEKKEEGQRQDDDIAPEEGRGPGKVEETAGGGTVQEGGIRKEDEA